ncbi:hypothetical protein RQ831_18240 [Roseomonas gilardii]|uniref:Uncharacterized protein n=1 Tax=Roseomonas gilardii TaxID=257708 RepID=A0ABU3MKK2_9PROT|nr:hypothetical protein [Roseomonas gilardii]MDT8332996.1 hypothetical protein [Roseomonas gilardii]
MVRTKLSPLVSVQVGNMLEANTEFFCNLAKRRAGITHCYNSRNLIA